MSDITALRSGEAVHIEAESELGTDFVDGYFSVNVTVVDSGRIVLPASEFEDFKTEAKKLNLSIGMDG